MTTISGYAFDCYGASVWGWTQYPYVEFDVIDLSTMLPVGVRQYDTDGYFGVSFIYSCDPSHQIAGTVRTYNALHIEMEIIPVFLALSCTEGHMADIDCTVEYQIRDDNGLVNPATLYAVIADTKTLADIQTGLNALTPKLAACIDGENAKINVTLHMAVVSGNAAPVAESNNNEVGNITFEVDGIKYPVTVTIPNYKDSLAVQGQIANTGATATLITELITPTGSWAQFTDKYLNDITAFLRGRTSFRGNRKQLARAASGRHNA